MKIIGIVAEYNPFHKGHAYQIKKIREIYGRNTAIVCVMSGDFVQRGEPAIFSKYARAEAAVRCGADLVIELPVHYCVASAERFAQGAITLLDRLGCVDYLAFGSECGNTERLKTTAGTLLTVQFDELVKEKLKSGCSYPVARSAALFELIGDEASQYPNDNLGVEYIKALLRLKSRIEPIAIKRVGAMHDSVYDGTLKSGSEIRGIIRKGEAYEDYVPCDAFDVYCRESEAGRGPVSLQQLEIAMLSRLRTLHLEDVAQLPDAAEGLENKLYKAFRTRTSLMDIYDTVKSKRYTHARIRRMTMCAVLGIQKTDYETDNTYARVLALNQAGAAILRQSEGKRAINVISKPAAAREMEDCRLTMFEKTASAHDLYVLGYDNCSQSVGEAEWSTSPVFVK